MKYSVFFIIITSFFTFGFPIKAARFRRPMTTSVGVNYGFDNNYGGSGCTDYGCGSVCYDGHGGTDFPLVVGTNTVAAASGTVIATYNGCDNYGYINNPCGGYCGNYVRIDHGGGYVTLHCHLKLNSLTVSTGQAVNCGQKIGETASSGSSTGPHLHFGFYLSGVKHDPFGGSCSQGTSYWVNQGSYPHPIPSTECESVCQCTPGQTQSTDCGNCGTQNRTCGSDCQWGNWSSCTGQGICAPGQTETRDCCDCGTQTRTCENSCQWSEYDSCQGPDPDGGTQGCNTGIEGLCQDGTVRCLEGCLECESNWEPVAETCDDRDEDCNGIIDDGFPATMGSEPPDYAARLVDISYPISTKRGSTCKIWVAFENVGQLPWEPGQIWLTALSVQNNQTSIFHDPESWHSYEIPSLVQNRIAPGEQVFQEFNLKIPADFEEETITESFQLMNPEGSLLKCPSPMFQISINALNDNEANTEVYYPDNPKNSTSNASDGCTSAPGSSSTTLPPLLVLFCVFLLFKKINS
ncbi:MAG: M23 family metallopeptidase [Deltaproteobacteria bacterium]|jgi:hypothetical protein|nr:M23 family metallopeptidase [Deltaproteobacteria bacterium]